MFTFRNVFLLFVVTSITLIMCDIVFDFQFLNYLLVLFISFIICCVYGSTFVCSGFYFNVICNGSENSNGIALTFDDGPIPGVTDKVLDILKSNKIKATFFCIGKRVYDNPELAKRIIDEGHIIASHTYHHSHLFDFYSSTGMKYEFSACDEAIEHATGKKVNFFRPPNGVTNPAMKKALTMHPYMVIGWSKRSLDTIIKNENKVVNRVVTHLKNGDIILFHDSHDRICSILETFLKEIKSKNLIVIELDELIKTPAYK